MGVFYRYLVTLGAWYVRNVGPEALAVALVAFTKRGVRPPPPPLPTLATRTARLLCRVTALCRCGCVTERDGSVTLWQVC